MAIQPQPPGWYPDPRGQGQRWWDGSQWTEHLAPAPSAALDPYAQSKQLAMFAHLSALLTGFLGPLIFFLVKKDDPFVLDQSREALNFNLSVLIYSLVSAVLIILLIGILLLFGVLITWFILTIIAGVKANSGEAYRYPLTIRMVT